MTLSQKNKISNRYIEQPKLDLRHIDRILSLLAQESDAIQAAAYNKTVVLAKERGQKLNNTLQFKPVLIYKTTH